MEERRRLAQILLLQVAPGTGSPSALDPVYLLPCFPLAFLQPQRREKQSSGPDAEPTAGAFYNNTGPQSCLCDDLEWEDAARGWCCGNTTPVLVKSDCNAPWLSQVSK